MTATTQAISANSTTSGRPRHGNQRATAAPSRPPPSVQSGITASSATPCTRLTESPERSTSHRTAANPVATAVGPRTPRQVANVRADALSGAAASCDSAFDRRALDATKLVTKNVAGPNHSNPTMSST